MPLEKISSVVKDRLPRFILDEYSGFVDFLDAYNRFLETDNLSYAEFSDVVSVYDIASIFDSDMIDRPAAYDDLNLLVSKEISDHVVIYDSLSGLFGKTASISSVIPEENVSKLGVDKELADSSLLEETIDISVVRGFIDYANISDSESKLTFLPKIESLLSSDYLLPLSVSLLKLEEIDQDDNVLISNIKQLSDSIEQIESIAKSLGTTKIELLSNIVDYPPDIVPVRLLYEYLSALDNILGINPSILEIDTTESADYSTINPAPSRVDYTPTTESIQSFGITKGLTDNLTPTEIISNLLSRPLADSTGVSDLISITWGGSLVENFVYMAEDYVSADYFYGSLDDYITVVP